MFCTFSVTWSYSSDDGNAGSPAASGVTAARAPCWVQGLRALRGARDALLSVNFDNVAAAWRSKEPEHRELTGQAVAALGRAGGRGVQAVPQTPKEVLRTLSMRRLQRVTPAPSEAPGRDCPLW